VKKSLNNSNTNKKGNIDLTPQEIVSQLDRYIVGQNDAKKAVAIALRNRYRRRNVESPLREEIVPKNILSIGPTGVGKTEIARRLAKLAHAPFSKVEATKFTEVGYVGKDVDSIIRDLLDIAIKMVKDQMKKEVVEAAKVNTKARILEALIGKDSSPETLERFSKLLDEGKLDEKEIEIEVVDNPVSPSATFDIPGAQVGMLNISDILGKVAGGEKTKKVKMRVDEATKTIINEESDKLLDDDCAIKDAIKLAENDGIVFIDEFDKICAKNSAGGGRGEVSREGVQRDLLPLIEGTSVNTKYGMVKTDHILFIASGAFHVSKPSDLLPELQGRFPIRVQLKALTQNDLVRILTQPESSLTKQYSALLNVENVDLEFSKDGVEEIAKVAYKVNSEIENIGARRLHTLLEKILETISFEASNLTMRKSVTVNAKYVNDNLGDLASGKTDLSKFIL
jgi:ATP-dependent HslUV protease ATP-binding subunit HslU